MRTAQVIAYFKTQEGVADALGIRQPSVAAWGEYPPGGRQLQLEKITAGKLKAEPDCMKKQKAGAVLRAANVAEPAESAEGC